MGFFDKVKNALDSKKEDVESRNNVNDEIIDKPTPTDKIRNFKYLDDLIHSGLKEIVLDSDIILRDDEESQYVEGIKLDVDELVIDGNGHAIDARSKTRIFNIHSGNINFKNIIFKNAFSMDNGGAIKFDRGNMDIENCTFIDNKSNSRGACLFCNMAKTSISNTQFLTNHAVDGGCIYSSNSRLEILESGFYNNVAENVASVILNQVRCRLRINDSLFKNNNSGNGGAILNMGKCEIANSIFEKNSTSDDGSGGAINNQLRSLLKIADTSFIENECGGDGGAIVNFSRANFMNVLFLRNSSKNNGGAISNQKNAALKILDSMFDYNGVEKNGGAIFNWGKIDLEKCMFKNNSSKEYGGAISNNQYGVSCLYYCRFTGNVSKKNGSALYNFYKGDFSVTKSIFTDNDSANGEMICNDGFFTIYDSTFSNNCAGEGKGLLIDNKRCFKIFDCEFSYNDSINIVANEDYLQIYDSIFKNNCANHVISNHGGATVSIFNGKFTDNEVEESVILNDGKIFSIIRTIFEDNLNHNINSMNIINRSELDLVSPKIMDDAKTVLNEDYIVIKDPNPQDIESKIKSSGTVDIAGVIPHGQRFDFGYLDRLIHESDSKEIVLEADILFENYERDYYEGGIELDVDDLVIDGNGKTINGANKSRIFVVTGKNIVLKNITFENGYSHKNYDCPLNNSGGVLRINSMASVSVKDCRFIYNTSEDSGGIIYKEFFSQLDIDECRAFNNKSSMCGGCIYSKGGELIIDNSVLSKNIVNLRDTQEDRGGIVYDCGELIIRDSTFSDNYSNVNGGALINKKGNSMIITSEFTENAAEMNGGAIKNDGELTVTDSTLAENTANSDGGAIYNNGSLTVTESTLNNNTAEDYGGAISNTEGNLTVVNSTLAQNTARREYGGAISNKEGNLTVADSTLAENTAQKYGGAIYLKKSRKYESENCTFKDNKPDDVYEEKD